MNCPACTTPMENPSPGRPDWWACPGCGLSDTETKLTTRRRAQTRQLVERTEPTNKHGNPLVRPARRHQRLAELATVICPYCTCAGKLAETVEPNEVHSGYYQCDGCGWVGPGRSLRPERTEEEAQKVQAVDQWGTAADKSVHDALNKDRRRGKKGGGSSNSTGRAKKPGSRKNTTFRPDRDEVVWSNIRAANALNNVVKVPELKRTASDMRAAVAEYLERQRQQREASGG